MTANDETKPCAVCAAYLEHYPIMVPEWDCEHDDNEQAFMLALADAVHGYKPEGEFIDPGWRSAQFLDDAYLAFDCGDAPYSFRIQHNVSGFALMALVNSRYLIGFGDESEFVADIGWLGIEASSSAGPSDG